MVATAAGYLERAIGSAAEDRLERREFAERLGKALVARDNKRATGVVVGLCGEWGSGKSSILNLVAEHLRQDRGGVVIQFDPWIVSGRDDMVLRLLAQIAKELKQEEKTKKLAESFLGYIECLSPVAGVATALLSAIPGLGAVAGSAVSGGAKLLKGFLEAPGLHDQRKRLDKALAECQTPVVVLVDELDRLDDSEIRAMAQFVRAVADFDHISYLLAYDQKRVAEALGSDCGGDHNERLRRGTAYLEKIVQHQIALPLAFKGELQRMLYDLLETIAQDAALPHGWNHTERCQELFDILVPGLLPTPRDLKRFAGMVHVQASMLGDVDLVDLMGWCAIQTKAPLTAQRIRERPSLVGGPKLYHNEHFFEHGGGPQERRDVLVPTGERSVPLTSLLEFLFPYFRPQDYRIAEPDCIQYDRPLLTLLRNGIPPGEFSRKQITAFVLGEGPPRLQILEEVMARQLTTAFTYRFAEVCPHVAGADHLSLWRDIAAFTEQHCTSWNAQDKPYQDFMAGLASQLLQNLHRHPESCDDFRDLCTHLHDWVITPQLLNYNAWAYGLFNRRRSEPSLPFLSPEETELLTDKLGVSMAMDACDAMETISRLRTPIPFILAVDSGHWGPEARASLTSRLVKPDVLDCLVVALFSNRSSVGHPMLDRIVDARVFYEAAEKRASAVKGKAVVGDAYDHLIRIGIPRT